MLVMDPELDLGRVGESAIDLALGQQQPRANSRAGSDQDQLPFLFLPLQWLPLDMDMGLAHWDAWLRGNYIIVGDIHVISPLTTGGMVSHRIPPVPLPGPLSPNPGVLPREGYNHSWII